MSKVKLQNLVQQIFWVVFWSEHINNVKTLTVTHVFPDNSENVWINKR